MADLGLCITSFRRLLGHVLFQRCFAKPDSVKLNYADSPYLIVKTITVTDLARNLSEAARRCR
jgi:hypothetical protein